MNKLPERLHIIGEIKGTVLEVAPPQPGHCRRKTKERQCRHPDRKLPTPIARHLAAPVDSLIDASTRNLGYGWDGHWLGCHELATTDRAQRILGRSPRRS